MRPVGAQPIKLGSGLPIQFSRAERYKYRSYGDCRVSNLIKSSMDLYVRWSVCLVCLSLSTRTAPCLLTVLVGSVSSFSGETGRR